MQNLSSLAADGPVTGSMSATNTVTETQPFSGGGTASESTAREPQGSLAIGTTASLPVNYPPGRVSGEGGSGQAYSPWGDRGPGGWSVASDDAGTVTDGWRVP